MKTNKLYLLASIVVILHIMKMTVLMTSLKYLIIEEIAVVLEEVEVEAYLVEDMDEDDLDIFVTEVVVVAIVVSFVLPLFKDHLALGVEMQF